LLLRLSLHHTTSLRSSSRCWATSQAKPEAVWRYIMHLTSGNQADNCATGDGRLLGGIPLLRQRTLKLLLLQELMTASR